MVVSVLKRALLVSVALVLVVLVAGAGWVYAETSAFDREMNRVRAVPLANVETTSDPSRLARGKHLVESLGGCATRDCHGVDLAGGRTIDMGPVAKLTGPNLTQMLPVYSNAEIVRLLKWGIKKDGRSVTFMPVQDFSWLPDADLVAIANYLRTVPAVDRPNGATSVGVLGKVLDRHKKLVLDVATYVAALKEESPPPPAPTREYGRFVAKLCTGCHGEGLSGGPIPGAPASMPVPLNITPDPTGLAGWSFADFDKLLKAGVRKNGKPLDPFMPVTATQHFDEEEMRALWAYLQSLPPTKMGNR